jgi:hypothetical protein
MKTEFNLSYLGIKGVELHKEIQSNLDKILDLPSLDEKAGFRIITVMAHPDGMSSEEEHSINYVVSFFKKNPSDVRGNTEEEYNKTKKDNHLTGAIFKHKELNQYPFASYALAMRKPEIKD